MNNDSSDLYSFHLFHRSILVCMHFLKLVNCQYPKSNCNSRFTIVFSIAIANVLKYRTVGCSLQEETFPSACTVGKYTYYKSTTYYLVILYHIVFHFHTLSQISRHITSVMKIYETNIRLYNDNMKIPAILIPIVVLYKSILVPHCCIV